jgi:hypothetical protein
MVTPPVRVAAAARLQLSLGERLILGRWATGAPTAFDVGALGSALSEPSSADWRAVGCRPVIIYFGPGVA